MTAPVQINEASLVASAASIGVAQSVNPTVGYTNVVWVRGPSGATVSGVSDTLGNTYTSRGSVTEAGTGQILHQFTAPITSGGASNTVTADYGGSTANRGIVVALCAGTYDAANTGTDTGNNPTTSVSATNTTQPATVLMLCNDVQGGTPGVGSGFTDSGTAWATVGLNARIQYKEVTNVGSQSGNFANAGFNRTNTGLVILADLVTPQFTVQPTDQTAADGGTASFATTVTGATSFQWETQAPNGGSWSNVSGGTGATTDDYTTAALSRATDAGRLYRLKATNAFGDTYSNAVSVTVTKDPSSFTSANRVGAGYVGAMKLGGGTISGGQSASITEAASASESSSASVIYAASAAEAATASDSSTATGGGSADSVTEAATASDSSTATNATAASITEAASAADEYSYPAGSAVPSLIAATSSGSSNGTSATTSQINTTGATQIRVYIACQVNTLTNGSVTDNKGNSYQIESGPTTIGTFPGYAYVFRPTAAPTVGTGHDFTVSGGASSFPSIFVAAVGPSSGGTVSVASAVVNQDTARPYTSSSVTPSQPNALLIGFSGDDSTGGNVAWAWNSPSSIISGTAINDHNSFWGGSLGQRSVTSSGSYSMEATNSGTGGQGVVAVSVFTEVISGGGSQSGSVTEAATASDSSTADAAGSASQTEAATASESSTASKTTAASVTELSSVQAAHSASNNDYQLDGAGTSPQTVTTTTINGKTLLLCVLGNSTQQGTPTDNKGNSYSGALLHQQGYAGGLWAPYDMRVYGLATAVGGTSHTFSVTKTDAVRESTLVAVATTGDIIRQASVVARAAAGAGANYTSASVTLLNPGVLIAFWSGDGGVALGSLDAAPQTGTGWTMPIGVFLESTAYIQHAMAWKQVPAGTYTITWDHADNQGAILSLIGIESSTGAAVDVVTATATYAATASEAATAGESSAAANATSASGVEAAAAAESSTAANATAATQTEAATAADSSTADGGNSASITEPATAGDSSSAANATSGAISEAASASETASCTLSTSATVSEAAAAAEAISAALATLASVLEVAAASETAAAILATLATLTEPATATDAYTGTVSNPNLGAIEEAANAADTITATQSTGAAVNEGATASETATAANATASSVTETATASEAVAAALTKSATISESAAAADLYTALQGVAASITEAASASEALIVTQATLATIIEAAAANDFVTTGNFLITSISEQAFASDFVDWLRDVQAGDPRVLSIEAQGRVITISDELRAYTVELQDRKILISSQDRTRSI